MTSLGLDDALAQLEQNYARAKSIAATTTVFPGFGTRASVDQALYVARRSIDFLAGDARTEVLNGSRTAASWNDLADSTNENLRTVSSTIPALSLSRLAEDFGGAIVDGALSGFYAGSTAVVVLGLAALALVFFAETRR